MIYFYTVQHIKTGMTIIGISKHDPRKYPINKRLMSDNLHWRKHLKKHGRLDRNGNSLLTITVLHQSENPNVLLDWKRYYYQCWNVLNNPKFIHSVKRSKHNIRRGKNHRGYDKPYITGIRRVWYTNGHDELLIPENTQPYNYKRGRHILKGSPNKRRSEQAKRLTKLNGAGHKCISPSGIIYNSLTDAARAEGVKYGAIKKRIKRGTSGWKYV